MGREFEDTFWLDGPGQLARGAEGELERVGGFVVGDDDDDRGLRSASEEREIEGRGRWR